MKLTNNQKLFIDCINGNGDKVIRKSWLSRGEIKTGNSLVKKGMISLNVNRNEYNIN